MFPCEYGFDGTWLSSTGDRKIIEETQGVLIRHADDTGVTIRVEDDKIHVILQGEEATGEISLIFINNYC